VKGSYIDINSAQLEMFRDWYYLPVYEYFALPEASQDPKTIARHFKDKFSAKDTKEAIELLIQIGLLTTDIDTGRFKQTIENIRFDSDTLNLAVRNFHQKMLDMTMQSVEQGSVNERDLRATCIAVNRDAYVKIKKELEEFMRHLNQKYSTAVAEKECLVQLNSQLIQITDIVDYK